MTFEWPPRPAGDQSSPTNTINLIDTPGHADFTFEVLRSLRILDGAVCILDGVAGVEAQTEQVWHQASTYQIPRIIYVNKLDRDGAAFGKTVKEIGLRLNAYPAVCQIPWFQNGNGRFMGVADVVHLRGLMWEEGGDGKSVQVFDLEQLRERDENLVVNLEKARAALVEILSEHDDALVEKFFEVEEDHLKVPASDINASIRRVLLSTGGHVVPVFAGASFRNIGVQPLLDAVTGFLPNPSEILDPEVSIGETKGGLHALLNGDLVLEETNQDTKKGRKTKAVSSKQQARSLIQNLEGCALAFKVVNDPKRGVLVYVRVYSGVINQMSQLYNTNLAILEKAPRLLKMYASEALQIDSIPAGQIGVIVGLKHARTGDTLISYAANKGTPAEPLNKLQLRPIEVPPPVFFASIEPHSLSEEKHVREALTVLLREDPSLHVTTDEDSGQTLLSGMGELHLEIARDRLVNDFKAKATMGRIEIGYREAIVAASEPITHVFDKETAGRKGYAEVTALVRPSSEALDSEHRHHTIVHEGNPIDILLPGLSPSGESLTATTPSLPSHLPLSTIHAALTNGARAALARGPNHPFPVHSTSVTLTVHSSSITTDTTPSALTSAARLATASAIKSSAAASGTALMEPVMTAHITIDEASLGAVVHDLSSARGGHVLSLDDSSSSSAANTPGSPPLSNFTTTGEQPSPIDMRKIYAPPDPFEASSVGEMGGMQGMDTVEHMRGVNRQRTVTARVPLREMVGYLRGLRSLTGGRGTFIMRFENFERVSGPREKRILDEVRFGG